MKFKQFYQLISEKAYHGTPHKITDKFDLKYMGRGEGVQAYGWGLYFAEEPEVAKTYTKGKNGNLYEVEISAYETELLDWDKTFDEQSFFVKNQLTRFKDVIEKGMNYVGVYQNTLEESKGSKIYKGLVETFSIPVNRGGFENSEYDIAYSKFEKASKFLLSLGIKGITYLDAYSRNNNHDTTRNYVIFDDKLVTSNLTNQI